MEGQEPQQMGNFIVRPDLLKNLLVGILKVGVALGVIIGVLWFFKSIGIMETFGEVLDTIGITIAMEDLTFWLTVALLLIGGLMMTMTYFKVSSTEYEFFPDHLEARSQKLILFQDRRQIPYENISTVTVEKQGIVEGLIGTHILDLELTGLAEASYKIPYVDDAEELAKRINTLANQAKMKQYQQYNQSQQVDSRLTNIMNEF